MARANRGQVGEGTYHVWRRTAGPIDMFRDDSDRRAFCRRLVTSIERHSWVCHAFVLMRTHFHLLLTVPSDALQPGMRDAFGPYAQEFNRRWSRTGHLRGGPYGHRFVEDERDLYGVVSYIANNPVAAGLCDGPEEYGWGSYRGTAAYEEPFAFVDDRLVLEPLDLDRSRAANVLRFIVERRSPGDYPHT